MFKKMISIIPVAALTLTLGTSAQAETVTVEKGDTLWDLSRANNTTVENLQKFNNLTTDLIHPGDVLAIVTEKQYTVKNGDTLWEIARDHQVRVSQIKEWNQLQTDLIKPGLNLVIFEGIKNSNAEKQVVLVASKSKETTPDVSAQSTNKEKKVETTPSSNKVQTEVTAPPTNKAEAEATPSTNKAETEPSAPSTTKADVKEITVEATAYTATCEGCSGITATGINLKENPDAKVISVDPSIIPLGSKVYVEGYGEAIAGDTGGAIKGNRIDVFVPSKQDAINFGVKQLKVKILD
ncbi:3D domain-containing protein [Ureibacillus acetophenoni]|uniref:3D (Asp-Asp-Asp) domain-containing protein n=1 Tax=Ureibacillus acetophenoni TaxID=614649 RepID=A0A285UP89_9BACL|nr:3D domain-containing protein [Ureibacillus acetophenoni]SOC43704.1 3D (Asp-Asp-Asp) domain-containing protein [Ureibacillus acetophenoni]